jgi:hypothetical protein
MDTSTNEGPAGTESATGGTDEEEETVRLWLVERTYSDDEQNIIILVYATPDGERYFRKERALVSFSDHRDTTAAVDVAPGAVGRVDDQETRARYAAEAQRTRAANDPDDAV